MQACLRSRDCRRAKAGVATRMGNRWLLSAARRERVTAGAARSKHEIMQELQALRQQRDAGTLSAADFETRKDALRREREAGKRLERGSVPGGGGHAAAEAAAGGFGALKFRSVTWDMVARSRLIDSLEDPVSGAPLDKSEYLAIYGEMLRTLDGQDSLPDTFLDFFFERDAVNHGHLRFINEERKAIGTLLLLVPARARFRCCSSCSGSPARTSSAPVLQSLTRRMRAPGWTGRRRSVFRQIWRQLKRANQRAKNKRGRVDCRRERQRRTLAAAVACWRQLTQTSVHADTNGCVHTGTCVPACEEPLAPLARACSPILNVHACMIAHRNSRTLAEQRREFPG